MESIGESWQAITLEGIWEVLRSLAGRLRWVSIDIGVHDKALGQLGKIEVGTIAVVRMEMRVMKISLISDNEAEVKGEDANGELLWS